MVLPGLRHHRQRCARHGLAVRQDDFAASPVRDGTRRFAASQAAAFPQETLGLNEVMASHQRGGEIRGAAVQARVTLDGS